MPAVPLPDPSPPLSSLHAGVLRLPIVNHFLSGTRRTALP